MEEIHPYQNKSVERSCLSWLRWGLDWSALKEELQRELSQINRQDLTANAYKAKVISILTQSTIIPAQLWFDSLLWLVRWC